MAIADFYPAVLAAGPNRGAVRHRVRVMAALLALLAVGLAPFARAQTTPPPPIAAPPVSVPLVLAPPVLTPVAAAPRPSTPAIRAPAPVGPAAMAPGATLPTRASSGPTSSGPAAFGPAAPAARAPAAPVPASIVLRPAVTPPTAAALAPGLAPGSAPISASGPTTEARGTIPQTAPADESGWFAGSWNLAGEWANTVLGIAGSAWRFAMSFVLPEAPFDHLPTTASPSAKAFMAVMDEAGYQLANITTGGGFLAEVSYRFVLAREPSEASAQRVVRALERHRENYLGPNAMAQRRIIQNLLDVPDRDAYLVTAVVVGVRPWPWIRYEVTRRDAAPEANDRRLLDTIAPRATRPTN